MGLRGLLAIASTVLLALCSCGDSNRAGSSDPAVLGASVATLGGTSGPRAIPATIVALELGAFPRPAAEACADNATMADVSPGESIAAAVAAASPGTTIRVAAGTYVENPDEWLALEIGVDDICIRAVSGDAVIEAAGGQKLGISLTGDDIVLEGLVLRGFETGIAIDGRSGETQRGLTIERTRVEDLTGEFREGIVVFAEEARPTLDGLLVLDVVVDGADLGVSCNIGPCEHVWVERTRIAARAASDGSGADAFAVEEGRQIVLVDTIVSGASADGIDTKADDVVVFGCRVYDLGRNGIKLWRGGDVINTIIDGTGADAALVGEEPGTYRYIHSLVTHHGEEGESGYVGTWSYDVRSREVTVEIVNSVFHDNSAGGLFIPDGAALSIRHTIFSGDAGHQLLDVGGDRTFSFAELAALQAAGFGTGNLIADPLFMGVDDHDYFTDPSSPARDAGEVIGGLEIDADGAARVQGAGPDIGPFES